MSRRNWTREELILALNLYLKLPFGKLHTGTREIVQLAKLIGRTSGAVAMRLNNFAGVDPFHQRRGIKGLPGGKKQVEPIWDEFVNNKEELLFESERILADREKSTIETKFFKLLSGTEDLKGKSKVREVKTRVNQHIFRQMVLSNYSEKCSISGINIQELLIASHIIPWSENKKERLNPQNGICLSALYDKAFDKGLISINYDYKLLISPVLKEHKENSYYKKYFGSYENKKINLPGRFLPNQEFLDYHLHKIFRQ